jgi:plasmid stabilization system protein ParE
MRAHLTPQAEIDLEEVGDYIALDNPGRAVSFIREIRQHCEKIAADRITTWRVQTWATRYGSAHTEIT